VLIQQTIIQETKYGEGAALSTTLVGLAFLINVAVIAYLFASGRRRDDQHAN